jgi:hypothetical protein
LRWRGRGHRVSSRGVFSFLRLVQNSIEDIVLRRGIVPESASTSLAWTRRRRRSSRRPIPRGLDEAGAASGWWRPGRCQGAAEPPRSLVACLNAIVGGVARGPGTCARCWRRRYPVSAVVGTLVGLGLAALFLCYQGPRASRSGRRPWSRSCTRRGAGLEARNAGDVVAGQADQLGAPHLLGASSSPGRRSRGGWAPARSSRVVKPSAGRRLHGAAAAGLASGADQVLGERSRPGKV